MSPVIPPFIGWSRLGLRARLIVVVGLVLMAFAVVSQGIATYRAAAEFRLDIARENEATLDALSFGVAQYAAMGDLDGIRELLAASARHPSIRSLTWVSMNGRSRLSQPGLAVAADVPFWFAALVDLPDTKRTRSVTLAGNRYGSIQAAFGPAYWEARLWRQAQERSLVAALEFAVLFVLITLVLHANLTIMGRLPSLARRFIAGDYGAREAQNPRTSPEVRELLSSLHAVAENMEATLRSLGRERRALGEQLHFERALLDAIPLPVFYKSHDGIYLGANRAWERFFGRSAESIVGKTVFDLYPGRSEIAALHNAKDQELWQQPGMQSYEMDIPDAAGNTRHTIYTKAVYRQADGSVGGIIGVIDDVSSLRRAETDLIRIREAVESASDALAICDLDGRASFVNRAFARLTGYDREGVNLKGGVAEVLVGDAKATGEVCPAVKAGQEWTGEVDIVNREQCAVTVLLRANPIRDHDGRLIGLMTAMTDMTQRKQMEAVSQRLGRILDQSLNEIYVFDADSLKFTQVNLGARRNLGYSLAEMQGMTPLDLKPDFDRPEFEARLAPLRDGRVEQLRFETVHRRRDGTEYPVQASLQLSRTESPQLFLAVVEDITDQRRAEDLLRANEEKYRALVEATNDWLWEVNADAIYTYVSPRVHDILGYEPEEVLGRRPSDFMPPEEAQRVMPLFAEIAAERKPLALLENINVRKDGRRVVLETSGLPVFDDDGRYLGYRGIDRDITARKQVEAAYRESEARFRSMAGNVPGMVFQFALQAQGELAFRYASDGALALCGCGAHLLLEDAQNFVRLIHAEDRPSFLRSLADSVRDLGAWNWEGRILSAGTSGSGEKWINWRASPRLLGDGTVLWDGVAVNITDARESQAALTRSREQLQALSGYLQTVREEEKSHIAREIHDELGGTLTALKMDAYWLGKKLPPEFDQLHGKLTGMLGMVDGAVQTTRRICTELRPTVLDDLGLMAAIEWQLAEFQKRVSIPCTFHRPRQDVELGGGMAIALFRILQESLTNVARHAGATSLCVVCQTTGENIFLAIEDDGRGIDPSAMDAGHSHGLRGIRERARQFGGEVDIMGTPGVGTVVMVQFPLQAAQTKNTEERQV